MQSSSPALSSPHPWPPSPQLPLRACPEQALSEAEARVEWVLPLWEAEKNAGLIVSYRTFLNLTANSSEDWDFGYAIVYQNMGAL
jgi:hypothetical protein